MRVRSPGQLGIALREARLAAGLTQVQLADTLDVSQRLISEMESGAPTKYARRLFDVLGELNVNVRLEWESSDETRG